MLAKRYRGYEIRLDAFGSNKYYLYDIKNKIKIMDSLYDKQDQAIKAIDELKQKVK